MDDHRVCLRALSSLALAVLLVAGVSCGTPGPKTHAVKGKVVSAKAEDLKQLVGQTVELQSSKEPNTRGFGQIKADGSFTISTYRLGAALPGAIEGKHKARLMVNLEDEDSDQPRKKKWTIDAKYGQFESSGWTLEVPVAGEVIFKVQ